MYTNYRANIRNEQLKLIAASVALALLAFVFLSFVVAYSFSPNPDITYKRVIVQEGDTLWGLAAQINDNLDLNTVVKNTMKYNNLHSSYILPGQVLYVPVK